MRKLIFILFALTCVSTSFAQVAFGGSQTSDRQIEYSQKFADVNNVGDGRLITPSTFISRKWRRYPIP